VSDDITSRAAPDHTRAVLVDGAPLLVHDWGASGGEPVLFWHALGPPLNGLFFGEAAAVLAGEHGCHVVAPDAPGFGGSPAIGLDRYRPSAIARLAVELGGVLGWADFHFVGHSWGATIGCHVCARFPQRLRSLALLDAGYQRARAEWSDAAATLERARSLAASLRFASWEAVAGAREPDVRRWSPWLATALAAGMRRGPDYAIAPVLSPEVYTAISTGVGAEPATTTYEGMRRSGVPILLVRATEPAGDEAARVGAADAFAAAVPQARVEVAHGCGHDVVTDLGPELGHRLAGWLRASARTSGRAAT
jgi:pimeloyl-ACP methyl ester carboxylesterase